MAGELLLLKIMIKIEHQVNILGLSKQVLLLKKLLRYSISEGLTPAEAMDIVNYRSRDNARTPMQWDESEFVGFSNVKPWIYITER